MKRSIKPSGRGSIYLSALGLDAIQTAARLSWVPLPGISRASSWLLLAVNAVTALLVGPTQYAYSSDLGPVRFLPVYCVTPTDWIAVLPTADNLFQKKLEFTAGHARTS